MYHPQQPSGMPVHRYRPYAEQFASTSRPHLADAHDHQAPRWCAVDLRDGNQALIDPMSPERKRRMFDLLVRMGYKEIEVGFPGASQTDFDFVRQLVEDDLIPDDVTIQVLTQARDALIERTYESIRGAKQAIVHLYNSTSTLQRRVVFGLDMDGIVDIAVQGARLCRSSPTTCPRPTSLRVLPGVLHRHRARVRRPRLRRGHRRLGSRRPTARHPQPAGDGRDGDAQRLRRLDRVDVAQPRPARLVVLSLHPHNDRGTAVAAAELGSPAGGRPHRGLPVRQRRAHRQRLPGHPGPRTCSARASTRRSTSRHRRGPAHVEYCNQLPVHERHPYGGDLGYTGLLRLAPGRDQQGFEAMSATRGGRDSSTTCRGRCRTCRSTQGLGAATKRSSASTAVGKGGVAYVMKTDTS
jgi:2-isopropylmalate synthase